MPDDDPSVDSRLDPALSAWVVSDGKIGDEVQCFGLAGALGLIPERRLIRPRPPWEWLTPWGPVDPREAPGVPGSPIAPPFPDVLIAAGRRTVPYLRRVRQASGGRTFTVFMKDPYTGAGTADVLCLPLHDRLRADNVVVAMTSPHRLGDAIFADARKNPDPRLAHLPRPRVAIVLGGVSGQYSFEAADATRLAAHALAFAREGRGVMVTPSRRTPPSLIEPIRAALALSGDLGPRAFVWDRTGDNPYAQILGNADAILVTADSVNMVGESCSTGKPVHVYEPGGKGHPKMTAFIDRLVQEGAARRFGGTLGHWTYAPIDSTPYFAREVARRYRLARGVGEAGAGTA